MSTIVTILIITACVVIIPFWVDAIIKNNKKNKNHQVNQTKTDLISTEVEKTMYHNFSLEETNFINDLGGELTIPIKGLRYRNESDIDRAKSLKKKEMLYLRKEPKNLKDPFAVAIYTDDDHHIGYVPAYLSKELTKLIDKYRIECTVESNSKDDIPHCWAILTYKSEKLDLINKMFNEKWNMIDMKETLKLRLGHSFTNEIESTYKNTTFIEGRYLNFEVFNVKETYVDVYDKIHTINYTYCNGISNNNLAIAEIAEKNKKVSEAIDLYRKNLDLNENVYKSALRLSILYNKEYHYEDSKEILRKAIELLKITSIYPSDRIKLEERLSSMVNNKKLVSDPGTKYMIERLKENIRRTSTSIETHNKNGKTELAKKAELRLSKYIEELKKIEEEQKKD